MTASTQRSIALVQMSCSEDPAENLRRAIAGIEDAAGKGAQIIALPELFRSPYFPVVEKTSRDYAEELPGQVNEALSQAARRHGAVIIGGSVYERTAQGCFNTAQVFDADGSLVGSYRKVHIPQDPGFFEQNYFKSGDLGFKIFKTRFGTISVLICFDQWFPEAARIVSLMGAEIIFYPTAIATVEGIEQSEGNWQEAWENVQRGHAIANNVIVAAVNRVGREGNSRFWGGSFVCDAFGKTLVRGSDREEIVSAVVDLAHNQAVREGWGFFRNRQPGRYGLLTHA